MALLTLSPLAPVTGVVFTLTAAAGGGDTMAVGDHNFLAVANGSGSPITVTIDSVALSSFGQDQDGGGSVAAGATRLFGPLGARFANLTDGYVHITYSAVTSVTVGAFSA